MEQILSVQGLHTYFYNKGKVIKAVEGVDLDINRGQVLGLVGESGCGKTLTAYSIINLIPATAKIIKGKVIFKGKDILSFPPARVRDIRGKNISMIFQEPVSALNPVYTVGFQVAETLAIHRKEIAKKGRKDFIINLLRKTGLDLPERIFKSYPHELSGGQAQRVLIAMAICCNPDLLIADEPTTALDVTIQVQIIELFRKLKEENQLSLIFISHDLRVCAQICDCLAVMYAGKVVESGPIKEVLNNPRHPYTRALLASALIRTEPKQRLKVIDGKVPDPSCKPSGCQFNDRCEVVKAICRTQTPDMVEIFPGHKVRCFNQV
jgi:peptide/nickel transport system ATP-binding protein